MLLTLIAAASENNIIGHDNDLPWHLPQDFFRFKGLTTGRHIIMGRKTFETFPSPLPNRTHVIITRQKDYIAPEGCIVVDSLENAIAVCPKWQEVFIIGGGQIYEQAIHIADKIELTRVNCTVTGDTMFPVISAYDWTLVREEHHATDEKHKFAYTFETWYRNQN